MNERQSVLIVHNRYQEAGGEDQVVAAESKLLREHGHPLTEYIADNRTISNLGKLSLFTKTLWNTASYRQIAEIVKTACVRVAHVHNTMPLVSPAAYYAARRQRAAVVQTLHNYRLMCPGATLYRDGQVCEECVGKPLAWPGVAHACYRQSRGATGALAGMLSLHRGIGTWSRMVDVYIALTAFSRDLFVRAGLPADRIVVKPNFMVDPGIGSHDTEDVLFVGRLTHEKGVETLLQMWSGFAARHPGARLKIIGTGPLASLKQGAPESIDWLGWVPGAEVLALMKRAAVLVFPSLWYEGFPVTLLEAFGTALPVVASRLGSVSELVVDGRTGRLFTPGDAGDLDQVLSSVFENRERRRELAMNARQAFEARYTPERNYQQLMRIYDLALERSRGVLA